MSGLKTIVQLVSKDETGDTLYRMRWPAQELVRVYEGRGEPLRVIHLDARAKERFDYVRRADLAILFQSNDLELLPVLRERRAEGKPTLLELNDNFYEPPPSSPVAKPWTSPLVWQGYEIMARHADHLMVTCDALKRLFAALVPAENISVIPNVFPFALTTFAELRRGHNRAQGRVRLGWAGSLGHMADLLSYQPVLADLLRRFPQLTIAVMGNEALPHLLRLPKEQCDYRPWGGMADYYDFLSSLDIGFAPLLDTPYNRCRSDAKAIEFGASGVAPLLSDAECYRHFLEHTSIPSFTNPHELSEAVTHLLEEPSRILALAEEAFHYVAEHRVAARDTRRLELYERLLAGTNGGGAWSEGAGFHDLPGTIEAEPQALTVIKQADTLARENKLADAVAALEKYARGNALHPDIHFHRTRFMLAVRNEKTKGELEKARKAFPFDLRFSLLRFSVVQDEKELLSEWSMLINLLRQISQKARDFWARDVARTFRATMTAIIFDEVPARQSQGGGVEARQRVALGMLRDLSELLPLCADLRLLIAEHAERAGDFVMAEKEYRWVEEHLRVLTINRDALTSLDLGFFETWSEALIARQRFASGSVH